MLRALPVCAVLLVPSLVYGSDEQPAPTETVIRMTVQPAPAPRPALKYQLLPELSEMNHGNPVQGYLKCFMEQKDFFFGKESEENREKWLTMPLKELPVKDLREYGGNALRQADYAARLDNPDWQILLPLKSEGVSLLLPELQQLRLLSRALKVRLRGEIAHRRLDDALTTTRTLFALSRHVGEHPGLVGGLIGISYALGTLDPLEEMIQQPGCPNLFWALTMLPEPFIDLRKGLQCERMLLMNEYGLLNETEPMSEAQLQKVINKGYELLNHYRSSSDVSHPKQDLRQSLTKRSNDEAYIVAARKRLIEHGLNEETVKRFPALQVLLLDEKIAYKVRRDEELKAMTLPYWQAQPLLASGQPARELVEGTLFGWMFVPRKWSAKELQARLDQRLALLRCVEALRIYAADHDGKLPAKLADIRLPLPVDPVTGQPFGYELKGSTAILRGTPPAGKEKDAAFNIRYEVTIGK